MTEITLGEAGIAWAVRLEPDPGSVGQRLLSLGSEPAKVAAAGTLPGPGLGIKVASCPGEALGGRLGLCDM